MGTLTSKVVLTGSETRDALIAAARRASTALLNAAALESSIEVVTNSNGVISGGRVTFIFPDEAPPPGVERPDVFVSGTVLAS